MQENIIGGVVMKIFIDMFIIFMPFVFVVFLIRNISKLIEIEKTIQFPQYISLQNSVNQNYIILKQHLLENPKLTEAEVLEICKIFKNAQLSIINYILGGVLQLICILLYCEHIDWADICTVNGSAQCAVVLASCVTFWIFYGKQFFEYIGLYRIKDTIDVVIDTLFKVSCKLEKAIVGVFCSFLYFGALLLYLCYFIPVIQLVPSKYSLIGVCILLFVFYYGVPELFASIYVKAEKLFKKQHNLVNKNTLYKSLKNSTYLHLLIIYFWGIIINESDSLLLYGINILFLFDTYLQNRSAILKEHLPPCEKGE